jgi:hypothetical protein
MATRILSPVFLVGSVALLAVGCGSPALVQCRLEAVKFLPEDPHQVTPYDVIDLVQRLNACRATADGGPHG